MRINNLNGRTAYRFGSQNANLKTTSPAKLSCGLQINSAKDDASGLAIIKKFKPPFRKCFVLLLVLLTLCSSLPISALAENDSDSLLYSDYDIYMADSIINGVRDANGGHHKLEGLDYGSLYEYAVFDKPLYREAAEYLLDDGLNLSATTIWAGLFDNDTIIRHPEYYYEVILMDYIKFQTDSSQYQTELGNKAIELGKEAGNEIFDSMVSTNLDPNTFSQLSKAEAGKIIENTKIIKDYKDLYSDCFSVATSSVELLNMVSDAAACAQAKEDRIKALEQLKVIVEKDGGYPDLETAINTVLSAIDSTDTYIAGKTLAQITDLSISAAWDAIMKDNPVFEGYQLTGMGFDFLFGSHSKEQSNLELLSLQIIDSQFYLAMIDAKNQFIQSPSQETASTFNGAYTTYTDFSLYGLGFIKEFAQDTISDNLISYLTGLYSTDQSQLVDAFTTAAGIQESQIEGLQAIKSTYHQVYLEIYRSYDSVYDQNASSEASISYCTHIQNTGWQNWVTDGQTSGTEGQGLRLEGIKIISNLDGVGLQYKTHVQNIGWQSWASDGAMSGTEGLSYRLEAIQIELNGENAEQYDVYYQVHAQNIGWMGWAKNGESAGTAGYGYRLEGIRIQIIPKGQTAPGITDGAYLETFDIPIVRTTENYYADGSHKFGNQPLYNSYYERPVLKETTTAKEKINLKYDELESAWSQSNDSDIANFIEAYNHDADFKSYLNTPYYNEVTSTVTYNSHNLISITQENYTFYGGIHPNTETTSNTFNVKTGEEVTLGDLLSIDSSDISSQLTKEFENLKTSDSRYSDLDLSKVSSLLNANSAYYLNDKGLCIYFNQYAVASYATGMIKVIIPYTRSDLLKPIETFVP
ncbi:DUF3298 domain-containing protein [Eubacteriaceae bacterium ES2]|nr:DUF3298 domain-containing protein [Eubacteriaceae bacterium ES2]